MKNLKMISYCCKGYESYYEDVMPQIEKLLNDYTDDSEENMLIAVNEAVCNAAVYSLAGAEKVEITINVIVYTDDIVISVHGKTRVWKVDTYRAQLMQLADDTVWGDKDWSEYTINSDKSRGLWLMLMSCNYLYIRDNGEKVTLCFSKNINDVLSKNIRELAHRFFIQNEDGVIY